MTDFHCAPNVHRTYAKRMPFGAHTLSTLFIMVFFPTLAIAKDWEIFRQICLTPMERAAFAHPTQLSVNEKFTDSEKKFIAYDVGVGGAVLLTPAVGSDGPESCHLFQIDIDQETYDWAEDVVEAGRYVVIPQDTNPNPYVLQSTDWREPKIEVHIGWHRTADGQSLSVQELKVGE